ncbi:MAG: ExbD/TolR family protein [Gammaproteobacteria bacterium]
MARKHAQPDDDGEINITPMLDIVFIMLIFFIVTTSFVKETGIDPERPVADTATHKSRGNILVAVSDNGRIWMQKKQVELSQVRALAEGVVSESPESSAVVIADRGAPTGVVIDVMDQIRLAKVSKISIGAEETN